MEERGPQEKILALVPQSPPCRCLFGNKSPAGTWNAEISPQGRAAPAGTRRWSPSGWGRCSHPAELRFCNFLSLGSNPSYQGNRLK